MSSSMETACLLSDTPEYAPKTWKEIDVQRWEEKASQYPAHSQRSVSSYLSNGPVEYTVCSVSVKLCDYETCFGRYWGII